ncbi:MAG TPA: hypothetical protein VMD05_00870 [Candidatus Nanoarchaeia archaeon]|nr:hypothetical protein [Candidatus Nanoarchaeia archaeon]
MNKRKILSYSFIIAAAALVLAGLFTNVGQVASAPVSENKTFEPASFGIPAITANITYTFTAEGSLSAQNPITAKVMINDVNTSNLLQYYQAVGFLGSMANWATPTNTSAPTPTPAAQQNVTYGIAHLEQLPNGTYEGFTQLIYQSEFDVYTFLIPQSWYPWHVNATPPANQQPIAHISGVTNTLTWQYNEETTKLMLVTAGFAVFVSHQAIEVLVRRKEGKKTQIL